MRTIVVLLGLFLCTAGFAQETKVTFSDSGITLSGENSRLNESRDVIELSGHASFSTSIVEIEEAEKIVYDRKNKTFTISGFKELRLNGEKQLAEDLGPTTLKIRVGDCIAYLIADSKACKGKNC